MWPHRRQPIRLLRPWDSPGKNTGVGCHFLLQCIKVKVKVKSLSRVQLLGTPWTAAHQAPPSMGFSRQEYWSGVPYTYIFLLFHLYFLPPRNRIDTKTWNSPLEFNLKKHKFQHSWKWRKTNVSTNKYFSIYIESNSYIETWDHQDPYIWLYLPNCLKSLKVWI